MTLDEHKWEVEGQAEGGVSIQDTRFELDEKGRIKDFEPLKAGSTGMGMAFDVGATYKVHGLEDLTLSAALIDMGSINHTRAQNLKTKDNAKWTFDGFKQAYVASDKKNSQELGEEFDQMGEDLKDMLNLYATEQRGTDKGWALRSISVLNILYRPTES